MRGAGRMGELGPHAEQGHREVGEFAARCGMGAVYTVGPEAALISNAFTASGGQGKAETLPRTTSALSISAPGSRKVMLS